MSKTLRLTAAKGMNNKVASHALPDGYCRNAVNVDFDDTGRVIMPRIGATQAYAGDCHSLYQQDDDLYFVESGHLKRLRNNVASTVKANVGNAEMGYCIVGDMLFYSNGSSRGVIKQDSVRSWGTARPPRQPTLAATTNGGLYAGTYRVAITWIGLFESGAGNSVSVDVAEGGGISVTNFPIPPVDVDKVALWVSSNNSESLFFYGEYPANISDVFIAQQVNTLPLLYQFGYPPEVSNHFIVHYGRIYWIDGEYLYYTEAQNYGVQKANNYFKFPSQVMAVASLPGSLIVGTEDAIYRQTTIDGEQASRLKLYNFGCCKARAAYDRFDNIAYIQTEKGFMRCTAEDARLISESVETPSYQTGALGCFEHAGLKRLVGCFQQGVVSPRQHPDYTAEEIVRKGNAL